jgi:crooked neck
MYVALSPVLSLPLPPAFLLSSGNLIVFELFTRSTSRHATIFVSSLYSGSIDAYAHLDPTNSAAWIKYAELETQLADYNRARGIFELGVTQTPLSMPELRWKAYIDFEVEEGERACARALYEWLAAASGHWKVWVAYAMFEAQPIQLPRDEREDKDEEGDEEDEEKKPRMAEGDLELARQVFQKGYKDKV